MILAPYLLFLFGLFVAAFLVLRAKKNREVPSNRQIVCPEARVPAEIEMDVSHPIMKFLRGIHGSRLRSCSRWPQFSRCDEECLAQIEPQLKVDGILARWYDGKNCATCHMPLIRADWQHGRAAALDEYRKFIPLRDMDWTQFPMVLDTYEPLCRRCHEAQLEKRRAATA